MMTNNNELMNYITTEDIAELEKALVEYQLDETSASERSGAMFTVKHVIPLLYDKHNIRDRRMADRITKLFIENASNDLFCNPRMREFLADSIFVNYRQEQVSRPAAVPTPTAPVSTAVVLPSNKVVCSNGKMINEHLEKELVERWARHSNMVAADFAAQNGIPLDAFIKWVMKWKSKQFFKTTEKARAAKIVKEAMRSRLTEEKPTATEEIPMPTVATAVVEEEKTMTTKHYTTYEEAVDILDECIRQGDTVVIKNFLDERGYSVNYGSFCFWLNQRKAVIAKACLYSRNTAKEIAETYHLSEHILKKIVIAVFSKETWNKIAKRKEEKEVVVPPSKVLPTVKKETEDLKIAEKVKTEVSEKVVETTTVVKKEGMTGFKATLYRPAVAAPVPAKEEAPKPDVQPIKQQQPVQPEKVVEKPASEEKKVEVMAKKKDDEDIKKKIEKLESDRSNTIAIMMANPALAGTLAEVLKNIDAEIQHLRS